MKIYIKNMVCPRCVMAVKTVMGKVGLEYSNVELGEVELVREPDAEQIAEFKMLLEEMGFELLDDARKQVIEKVKSFLIQVIQSGHIDEHFSLSEEIAERMHKEYSSISKLFSQVESVTIEQFFILQKIEKVKEWLAYDEYTLSEIAYKLGYSSVGYLSNQFKKTTGYTPTVFKQQHRVLRKPLDGVS